VNLLALGTERRLRETTIDLAQIQPGDNVLDVGCGTGILTILAKEAAGSTGAVYGIDAAPEMIEVAASKASKAGVDVDFSFGVVEKLDLPTDRFDLVLSSLMVHHLPGDGLKSKAFAEMYRVLKPGARLLIVDFEPPKNRFIRWLLKPFLKGMLAYDIRSIIPLLEEVGFTEIESGSTGHRLASFVSARKVQVY
jgi:demethylmenaquinone methyltransferase/2-methoxy-6-polyprenyl-1,4-benzoquinol methylase/phosphoethanolamine N-methyltransferase